MVVTKYVYDKEYYLSLNKKEKLMFIRKTINELVTILHNPDIIEKNDKNQDVQYELHSDCSVKCHKIGESSKYDSQVCTDNSTILKSKTFFTFPKKCEKSGDTYAVLKVEECFSVKELVDELIDILYQK